MLYAASYGLLRRNSLTKPINQGIEFTTCSICASCCQIIGQFLVPRSIARSLSGPVGSRRRSSCGEGLQLALLCQPHRNGVYKDRANLSDCRDPSSFRLNIFSLLIRLNQALSLHTSLALRNQSGTATSQWREGNMLLLARTMSFGQGKVTNKQAGACSSVNLSSRLTPSSIHQWSGREEAREVSLASSLRTHRYELDQRNCCEKNMLSSLPL